MKVMTMIFAWTGVIKMRNDANNAFDYADHVTETLRHSQRMTARALFELIFVCYPKPAAWLLAFRDRLVKSFGLKTGNHFEKMMLSETAQRIVLGQEDKHLDFYVVLECSTPMGSWQDIRVSTYVKYHNIMGRLYFGGIRPFHVLLVKRLVKRAARLWMKNFPRY